MSTPREGQRVAFVGDPQDGLQVGDCGKVLSSAEEGSHVLWSSGSRTGEVFLVENLDLVTSGATPRTYDDLDSGSLVTIAVRDVYEGMGHVGLLNALNDEGHLATFAPIAEEAMQMVAARIRQDPSIGEVLASLDSDEGQEFVTLAVSVLLRDAFGYEEG